MKSWTILSLLNWTTDYFTRQGIPTPRLDAEVLLAYLLNSDRLRLYLQFEKEVMEVDLNRFKGLIQRRVQGEPVSYIRGMKEFWSLPFKVGPGVMIPRPETEVLVEKVNSGWRMAERQEPCRVLDIGTGSGNLAVVLAREFPQAKIVALDISEEALAYARQNAETNGVSRQIEFIKQDFLALPYPSSAVPYDLIVSNPPYIPTAVLKTLPAGVKDYEPKSALDGGIDGLDFYKKLAECAKKLLKPEGMLAVEIGEDQGETVSAIFKENGLKKIEVIKDYSGLPRVIVAYG